MTDTTNTNESVSKAPLYTAYLVSDMPDGKAKWTKIGAAWAHGDENGLSLKLDGSIALRKPKKK